MAGSVVADVEGWMNNPKSVWEPLKGVGEGVFDSVFLSPKEKGHIQNVTSKLSDIPGMWDHAEQTFTPAGLEQLKKVLQNDKYVKYAVNLTADDFDESIDEARKKKRKKSYRVGYGYGGGVDTGGDGGGMGEAKQRLDPKCWTGYRKQGTKMKGGKRVNNCVKIGEGWESIMDDAVSKLFRGSK